MIIRPYARAFERFAAARPEVLCLSADLTSSCEVDGFRDRYPSQFLSFGMAEQNMLGFAAGLAMQGYRPFIHTFGVFLYRRPYDQLVNSIAYSNRKVRLMGFLPGLTTPGGITHQAIEDIAVMRTIPNMTVLETGDATEVETICEAADAVDGPVYVRVLRGEVPRLFSTGFEIGRMRTLRAGTDVLVLTSGVSTEDALAAVNALDGHGVSMRHLHISTFKPFDPAPLLAHIAEVRFGVVTMENHLISGGLGTLVSEVLAEHGVGKKLIRLGLVDTFAHGASKGYLMRKYGIDGIALVRAVERLIGQPLPIEAGDLDTAKVQEIHSENKAEAL